MSTSVHSHGATVGHADHHDHHDHGPQKGWRRWLYATNHKDIGTMYLLFSLLMFLIGGTMALIIRAELFQPGLQLVDPGFFNTMTTVHALIMVFGAVMPATVGLANWMIPLQIGAPDMAMPRMNNFSFWLLVAAFTLLILSLFVPGGGPAGGWTLYPPLTLQMADSLPLAIFAIHVAGASSIMGAINIIDLADHGVPADRGDAGAGGRRHHAAHRPLLRHQLLQRGRRR
jgi:cytochrome c oxidase subunit 1